MPSICIIFGIYFVLDRFLHAQALDADRSVCPLFGFANADRRGNQNGGDDVVNIAGDEIPVCRVQYLNDRELEETLQDAERALRRGEGAKSADLYANALVNLPKNPSIWMNFALALELAGDEMGSIEALDRGLQLQSLSYNRSDAQALLSKGRLLHVSYRNRGLAVRSLLEAKHVYESSNDSLGVANVQRELGELSLHGPPFDWTDAIPTLKRALEMYKQVGVSAKIVGDLRLKIGIAYVHIGREKTAWRYFKAASKDIPRHPILSRLMRVNMKRKKTKPMLNHKLKALGVEYFERGEELFEAHDLIQSRYHFSNALLLFPSHLDAYHRMGLVLLAQGNIEGSTRFWRQSFAISHAMTEEHCKSFR